ncbi:uroporphyrinogen-III C-methyltransferase [Pleurocapsa sp. CCALA 161]|uniref:uroporphyrinogen-III C-methyltransferase n=1 Tax=Pleurocapsa sp. CCALA 161 TaxID=2107688 RepID=UPI000D05DDE2|nr:uroporphyrinogen-III C-methyltransferase [Pleurocapsa sp. CCALA 161]PSB09240.1 uroporphyrinogen-III C-methyltransferase [Pleurocapsa sp. CCALA 161]
MTQVGKVYLVGAGIGNEDYLTVRGKQLLSIAQVLIYDALVDESLLKLVPLSCIQICVGKRGGQASTPQEEINQLLVNYCLQNKQIVRLKSGDPFIFGRANEEIVALQQAKCNFELVPGISSALAAPLLAGIPLTDKNLSHYFVVLSGHQPEHLDWSALARIDTLVILMGGRALPQIIENLLANGRSPEELISIIRHCGRPQQQIFWGTLTDIVDKTAEISLSPAVIVIGKVVQLSNQNSTQTSLPLVNKTILVTRAAEQSSKFTYLLQQQGATVVEMPALTITPPSNWSALDRAIANLADFQWLVLTSANGVNYFFERLNYLGYDARALGKIKIAVVGRKTAGVLQTRKLNPDFIPPNYVADSMVEHFPEALAGQKLLFPRVETGGRDILVQELTTQGAEVVEVAAYQSQCPQQIDKLAWQALQQLEIDVITFASSKTVKNFDQLLQQQLKSANIKDNLLDQVCIASIGPQTSKTCQELLGRVDLEAAEYTLEGLTTAIANYKLN